MMIVIQYILLSYLVNLIETTKLLPLSSLSAFDVIINTEKAFASQRIGILASNLKQEIVHTFVPPDDLCATSTKNYLCVFTSGTAGINILGIATVIPSRDTIATLPHYNKNQVSNFVENDLVQALRFHYSDELIAKANSIVHLIDYNFTMKLPRNNPCLIRTIF